MDPLSISASIAGLISITDMIAGRSYKYIKEARGATKEVKKLLEEITDLFGILSSLRLVASRYQDEAFDCTMQSQYIYTCHSLLEKIKDRLDKADPSQVDEKKSPFWQKASTLGRTLVWPFSSAETKGLIAEVANQKATLSLALAADGMNTLIESLSQQKAQGEDIAEIRENIRAQRAEQALSLLSNERKEILDSIGSFDPSGHQNIAIKLRQPGTGVWFTEGPQFKHWVETPKAKLWLYGIPGAGKTVLTSSIVQAAGNQTEQANGIAYFYCDYKDSKTHDPLVILGALVRQLAIQNPRCFGALEKFYNLYYPESGSITGLSVTPEDLCLLIQSLSTFFDEVMIIVDALDESGNDRSKVVELLASLNTDHFNIKTLFTSRLETDIELHLDSYEKISIAATSSDLKLYVASEIESRSRKKLLRTRDPDLKKEIMDRLVEGAEGMFRWVACQMDYLCELNTDKAIRKALNSLPPTLYATYERILDRVNSSNTDTQQLVQRVLMWIVCSKEPLSTKELLEAVSISEGDTELDLDAMPDEEGILKWCSSLVRRTPDGNKLELAHFTVEEFLLAIDASAPTSPYARYKISPGDQNILLAKLCLTYLLFEDFQDTQWTGKRDLEEFTEKYGFYGYSSEYWAQHALAHRDNQGILDLVKTLLDPSKTANFLSWSCFWIWTITENDDLELTSNTETLHFAAALSFYDICKWLINEKGRISDLDKLSTMGTPLYCALTALELFDTLGVTPPHQTLTYEDSEKEIYDRNRQLTFECLLDAGARIDNIRVHPRSDWTPLSPTLKIKFGWDILLENGVLLDDMSLEVVEDIIKGLTDVGLAEDFLLEVSEQNLDEQIRSKYVNVALQMENTRQQAVTMMSKGNGALNKVSFDDSSALLKAAMVGQTRVVRELLDEPGIDIDFRNPKSHGQTALHYACYNGHLEVVKLLVEHGASLEVTDKKGMTPFLEAAGAESLDVVKYLEEKGSDINVVTQDGRTILHISAAGNSVSNLEHLLQSPRLTHLLSSRSKNGRTVLLCAVQAGSVETARFILQRSSCSDVLRKTDDGHTCLHYAAISGKTSEGFTALHYAAKSSEAEVPLFRALLDHIDRVTDASHLFTYPTLIDPHAVVQRSTGIWTVDDFVGSRRLDVSTSSCTMSKTALQLLLSADPFTHSHSHMIRDIVSCVGLDLERQDRERKTPLIVLANRLSSESGNANLLTGMQQLLDRRVDPDTQDVSGRTALHYLCDSNTFSLFVFQAIVYLIGADGWFPEVFTHNPTPPPPPPPPPSSIVAHPSRNVKAARCSGRPGKPPPGPPPPPIDARFLQPIRSPGVAPLPIRPNSQRTSDIARVDIQDKTRETALQAFFRNLGRTHNFNHATEIAIRMLNLSAKSELDRQLPNGSRLFNLAIIIKNDKLIQELYNLGVNTKDRDSTQEYRSPLELFCIHGARDTEILRALIKACKNLSELDFNGLSLLHLASNSGHIKVVRELIEGGLKVNIQSRNHLTALCYAVDAGHTSIVELLLDNGAKMDDSCPTSENWQASLRSCAPNVATCILLDDRSIGDWTERTKCTFESRFVPGFTSYRSGKSTTGWISRFVHQLTPLHHMAFNGYLDVFEYVVEHVSDIDVDVVAESGIRPLFCAVLGGKISLVRYLLEQGARPGHVFFPSRWAALHLAAHLGTFEIVKNLLEHGADPCVKDRSGLTPSILALQAQHLQVSSYLEKSEESQRDYKSSNICLNVCHQTNSGLAKPLHSESAACQDKKVSPALADAIIKGDLKLCQHLIGRGFSIDGTCECGCTVLIKACVHNQVDIATYLFQLGASVHGVACSKEFTTAGLSSLHLAAFNGQLELFESILKQDPVISKEGIQPIHLAARSGRLSILRFVLEHAKSKRKLVEARNSKTRDGPSGHLFKVGEELGYACPLHFAVQFQHVEAAEILLRAGAALEAREERGLTALQLAAEGYFHKDIFDLLIGVGANPNTQDHEGISPLMRAASRSHGVKVVEALARTATKWLDLQATDIFGRTALHHAVENEKLDIANYLVTAGLDPTKTDHFGNSSIQIALQREMDPFPLENLPKVDTVRSTTRGSILNTAAFMGHEEVVTELLKRAPEIDVQEYVNLACDTGTPLYSATSRGNISIMEKLCEKGAKINLVGGPSGSPLMIACTLGHVGAVAWLLRRRAELQSTKVNGTTITAEEAAQQHENVLFLLRRFKEKGVEALDEEIPIQTANISKLDEFMVGYNERKESVISA